MYKLLIVDDEAPAVHALQCMLDWEEQGISEIYTALNAANAKRITTYANIDIVICDIQMPGEDGFALMQFFREHFPETQFIFLSAYDLSEYIRTAIHNGCLDYLLKPVEANELQKVVSHAIQHLKQQQRLKEYSEWEKQREYAIANNYIQFWREYMLGCIPEEESEVMKISRLWGLQFSDKQILTHYNFVPFLLTVRQWYVNVDAREKNRVLFAIRNNAEEMMFAAGCRGQVFILYEDTLAGCFMAPEFILEEDIGLKDIAMRIHEICDRFYACGVMLALGNFGHITQVPQQVRALQEMIRNVATDEPYVILQRVDPDEEEIPLDSEQEWMLLLQRGTEDQIVQTVTEHLNRCAQAGQLTVQQLRVFRQHMMRLAYTIMAQEGIEAYQPFGSAHMASLEDDAMHSIRHTATWCAAIAVELRRATGNATMPLLESICTYINEHLDENLSREDLSGRFFLNPDYLSRWFKQATGKGLKTYIQDARIKRACFLLQHTSMSIGDVAQQTGFQNHSYFCKVFRDTMHLSPQSWRQQYSKED